MRTHEPSTIRWSLPMSVTALIALLVACGTPLVPPATNAPVIQSLTATPDAITTCESSTLAWSVTGNSVTVTIAASGSSLHTTDERTGELVVTPSATTTYTLTATNAGGSVSDDVIVTVTSQAGGTPTLTNLTAATIRGSQVELEWDVANAGCIEVFASASSAADAPTTLITPVALGGSETTHIVPIPASDRQTIRVCAISGDTRACDTTGLTNVVTSSADYDPYYLEPNIVDTGPDRDVPWPEAPIPGTLRAVIANAADGAIIGFASDIDAIQVRGVDLWFVDGFGFYDAHLILTKDVTISGPPSGVTLEGVTAWRDGNPPGDPFTYRSRMIKVAEGVVVTLEHLTITGGTFIYKGAGIFNDGTLTILDSAVIGNRAWEQGGGIYNTANGVLRVERTVIGNNEARTTDAEIASGEYFIRRSEEDGGFRITMNDTGQGGGLYLDAGSVTTLIDTLVEGNRATENGGGIYHRYTSGQQDASLVLTRSGYGSGNSPQNYLGEQVVAGPSVSPASTYGPEGPPRKR